MIAHLDGLQRTGLQPRASVADERRRRPRRADEAEPRHPPRHGGRLPRPTRRRSRPRLLEVRRQKIS